MSTNIAAATSDNAGRCQDRASSRHSFQDVKRTASGWEVAAIPSRAQAGDRAS